MAMTVKAPTVMLMMKSAFKTRCSSVRKGVANRLYVITNTAKFNIQLTIDIQLVAIMFLLIIVTLFNLPEPNFSALIQVLN